ncbi:MAG: FtsX-like permease family protein, partial [Lachnospiraceae bacterium]
MRKVNNRKVIRKIADKTRKAGKSKNIIPVLAIAMTALLFTSVFTIGGSMIEKQQESTMRQVGGSAHAGYKYLTQEEYDIVKQDEKLKEVSYRIIVGDAVNDDLKKLHTEISYYEDLDAKFSFCYPEKGHMPEKEDELVTSDLVLQALGISCELGQKVPLVMDVGGEKVEKTFTLCGYFKGDTVSQAQCVAVSKEYANKVAPTPTTSVLETGADASDYTGRIMADFNFASTWQLEKQVEELTKRCGFPENIDTGINWAYMGTETDPETVMLIAVLLLVILASGYLIIYNIFYINIFNDIRHYGLLKTIGTTGKQLRKIVRRQAFILSLYGIPIGLVLGVVVGKLLLPTIMEQLSFSSTADTSVKLNPWIFISAATFSLFTVYLSCIKPCRMASKVTPVEAVRFTEGQNAPIKKKEKTARKVTPRRIALQNMRRNRKKVIVVVASLSMALVLLNSIYSLISGFDMDKFAASLTVSDFAVSDATLDNVSVDIPSRVCDGVTKEFQQELEKQKGVQEIGNIYLKQLCPTFTDEDYEKIKKNVFENPLAKKDMEDLAAKADDQYLKRCIEERDIDGNVYGISKLVMEKLENPDAKLDWEKFKTGKYVIVSRFGFQEEDKEYPEYFHPGETVTIFNEDGESRQYEVLAAADMPYACGWQVFGVFNCNYILPEQEYLDFMGEQKPMRTLINVKKEKEEKIEKWLENYCTNVNNDLTYTSKSKIVKEFDSVKKMYSLVGGLLAFVLAIIGILNFINTMVTSIISRKQELAMMEAVGMTG